MIELWIYLDDDKGNEKKFVWKFAPANAGEDGMGECSWDILRNDKPRATGADATRPYAIKEIRDIVIGAATLKNTDHHANFHRLLLAKRILWRRKFGNIEAFIEFSLRMQQEVVYEYLKERRSLKRKTVKLAETHYNMVGSYEQFLKDRLAIG